MHRLSLLIAMGFVTFVSPAPAQCPDGWRAYDAAPNGSIYALEVWDPDGTGPASELLVACGAFTEIGGVACKYVAAWDGQKWTAMGGSLVNFAHALAVYNGKLYCAADGLYEWSGAEWIAVPGSPYTIECLLVHDGSLIVGWTDDFPGCIGRWDGTQWYDYGPGFNTGYLGDAPGVDRVVIFNGELYACGNFQKTGSRQITPLARWDGIRWNSVSGFEAYSTFDMGVHGGEIYISVDLPNPSSIWVQRWNGATWLNVPEFDTAPSHFGAYRGELVVSGSFDTPAQHVVFYDGNTFIPLGGGIDGAFGPRTCATYRGDLIVGGGFTSVDGMAIKRFAVWGPILAGDVTHDQRVSLSDLGVLLSAYGLCPGETGYDLAAGRLAGDGDDCVTLDDLGVMLVNYGRTCD